MMLVSQDILSLNFLEKFCHLFFLSDQQTKNLIIMNQCNILFCCFCNSSSLAIEKQMLHYRQLAHYMAPPQPHPFHKRDTRCLRESVVGRFLYRLSICICCTLNSHLSFNIISTICIHTKQDTEDL